jgi:hypothetical protein
MSTKEKSYGDPGSDGKRVRQSRGKFMNAKNLHRSGHCPVEQGRFD